MKIAPRYVLVNIFHNRCFDKKEYAYICTARAICKGFAAKNNNN